VVILRRYDCRFSLERTARLFAERKATMYDGPIGQRILTFSV
jgi:hypothetical protein